MKKLNEDAPTNSTGPAVAGTNGDPIVNRPAQKRYKKYAKGPMKRFVDFLPKDKGTA